MSEKLKIMDNNLRAIQNIHKSDIRSMINFMQCNQDNLTSCKIITNEEWNKLTNYLKEGKIDNCVIHLNECSKIYNMEKRKYFKRLYFLFDNNRKNNF